MSVLAKFTNRHIRTQQRRAPSAILKVYKEKVVRQPGMHLDSVQVGRPFGGGPVPYRVSYLHPDDRRRLFSDYGDFYPTKGLIQRGNEVGFRAPRPLDPNPLTVERARGVVEKLVLLFNAVFKS